MTEDEIGDVGNRGVNQRESHSFFEDHYRLVVYSVGWLSIHHHIEIRNLRRFPLKMMKLHVTSRSHVMTVLIGLEIVEMASPLRLIDSES